MSELLHGRHAVLEALRARRRHLFVFGSKATKEKRLELWQRSSKRQRNAICRCALSKAGSSTSLKANGSFAGVSRWKTGEFVYSPVDEILRSAKRREGATLLLLLDHIQDPQNFGTLLFSRGDGSSRGDHSRQPPAVHVTPAVSNASSGQWSICW